MTASIQAGGKRSLKRKKNLKRLFILIFVLVLGLLAACGEESRDDKEPAEAEVVDIIHYKWFNDSIEQETITVYAEIKNTSDTDIDGGVVDLTYLDSKGNVIAENISQIVPFFLKEGGTGYISSEAEGDMGDYKDLAEVKIEASPVVFQETEIVEFTIKDQILDVSTWEEGGDNTQVYVSGLIENKSDLNFNEKETMAIVGLYDKADKFVGVSGMYSYQAISVKANASTSFEIGGEPLPPEMGQKADYAKVEAVGTKNMGDY